MVITGDCIVPSNTHFDKDGYPRIKYKKRIWRMNRWMWTLVNGHIPDNMVVAHRCNNKSCINTNHFYLTTAEQNSTDAAIDGLYKTGEKHGRAILSDKDVLSIGRLYHVECISQQKIGEIYGVSQSQVSYVLKRRLPKIIDHR